MDLWLRNRPGTEPRVPEVGPLAMKTGWNGAMGAGGWTLGAGIGLERRYGCRRVDLWGRNQAGTALWVPADGPLGMKTGGNGAMGAGGCTFGRPKLPGGAAGWTFGDGIGLERSYGCWQMDLWVTKAAGVPPDGP